MPASTRQRAQSSRESTGRPRSGGRAASEGARPGNRALGRLMLGAPDTGHERSADRAADAVVAGRSAEGRAAPVRSGSAPVPAGVEAEIHAARGGGRALGGPVRRRLQRSLSADLGAVRVHTDDRAHRISAGIGAEAATVGRDIFFRRGRFRPQSVGGLRTLAHEVAHSLHQPVDSAEPAVVQRTIWRWDKPRKSDEYAWVSGDTVNEELLADIGPGEKFHDLFDDASRMYQPWDPEKFRGQGGPDLDNQRLIPTGEMVAKGKARDTKRTSARRTLRGVKKLRILATKLADAGFNYSTVPDRYIENTDEYKSFKSKKKVLAGGRAKLACRLVLRDLASGLELGDDVATTYMDRAKVREESTKGSTDLAGKFKWKAFESVDTTDFGKWAMGTRDEPSDRSTMNCWESVIYGAYKAGHITREKVGEAYTEALAIGHGKQDPVVREGDGDRLEKAHDGGSDPTYMIPIEQLLTRGKPREFKLHDPDTERPLKGDIVAYGTFGSHVAVAEGNMSGEPKVVSLYDTPNAVTSVQRVTISSFMGSGGYDHTRTWMYRPFWA